MSTIKGVPAPKHTEKPAAKAAEKPAPVTHATSSANAAEHRAAEAPKATTSSADAAEHRALSASAASSATHAAPPVAQPPVPAAQDHTSISAEAKERGGDRRKTNPLLAGLANSFGGEERRSGVDRRQAEKDEKQASEAARHDKNDKTLDVLQNYSDFTNGKDDITSKKDYQKIAAGQKNEEFAKYLKEKHPEFSQTRIDQEVKSLQNSSKTLISDPKLLGLADTGKEGVKGDDKISDKDLATARLKNDISKDRAPKLTVSKIAELHEKDPAVGNQAVTNKYAHEAQDLSKLLGGDKDHFIATWPAFGQQASNSAGSFIRDDGVPGSDKIQNAVAEGNRDVFKDIAPHFDSYIEKFSKDPKANFEDWKKEQFPPAFDKDGKQLKDKDGKPIEPKPELEKSFEFLEKARNTKDPEKKQEYLLASNALAASHEQKRLDGRIDTATAPGTSSAIERKAWDAFAGEKPKLFLPNGKGSGDLSQIDVTQKLDVPDSAIPKGLEKIDDPDVRKVLQNALQNPDADVSSARALIENSGTADWSKLPDRMRTIVALMAGGQTDPRLGEYALNYNLPPAQSTIGHAKAVASNAVETAASAVSPAIDAGKTALNAGESVLSTAWSLIP